MITLTQQEYAVLHRVPATWWNEDETVSSIADAALLGRSLVRAHLSRLERLRLIERRTRQTITPTREVRRIGRDDGE